MILKITICRSTVQLDKFDPCWSELFVQTPLTPRRELDGAGGCCGGVRMIIDFGRMGASPTVLRLGIRAGAALAVANDQGLPPLACFMLTVFPLCPVVAAGLLHGSQPAAACSRW